jgi:WD40 repeat protein/DNA-binding winged helix-turn-helix (wHTH) protein
VQNGRRLVYEFGDFRLDPGLRILLRKGEPITVWPKVFDTLSLLLQSSGRIVEKEELMQALWPESFVEESNLTQNIFILRKILGDDRNGHSFIQTVPRRGYKFIAPVREADLACCANDLPAAYWRGRSPFRGLQVFEPEDAWLFFGREPETDELLAHLRRSAVLSVVGNSGSGKSSLLRAGLIPALQQGRFCPNGLAGQQWRIALFRPSGAPLDSLAEVLPGQLAPELSLQERAEFIREIRKRLTHDPGGLRDAIAAMAGVIAESAGPTRILLVADQFEEIFTFTSNREERDHYIDALLGAARFESAVPVHVVFAMRADFYPECMEHAALSRAMAANQYNVGRMSHEQLRESIEKRLHLASAQAEAGLIDSLLQDVGSEPGNLALLEHALGQLWERCGGFGCTLTNRAYAEIGRLQGALGRHADEIYSNLRDEAQKHLAKRIFLELVHVGDGAQDTRRRIAKADLLALAQPEEVETLLGDLASKRLISTGGEEQESYVEVSHEALIREWPLLREWIAQNREDLRLERRLVQTAEEWNGLKRDQSALLRGARLAQAEEWLGRHPDATALLHEFVEASVVARKEAHEREVAQEKAAATRLRWFSFGLAVLLVLAIATAGYIYHQRIIEKSRAMAAESGEMLSRDHGQALDLAIRSWETARTEEARAAVTKALPQTLAILKHEGAVTNATFSPDGKLVLTGSADHTASVWDGIDGHLLFTLRGHTGTLEYVDFSADGSKIVTAGDDHMGRVWSSKDGHLLFVLRGHSARIWRAEFSHDGTRIVTASDDKTARVWDSNNGHLLFTLQHEKTVGCVQFSPDSKRIATASWDHTARLWDSADGHLLKTFTFNTEVLGAKFSPDNRILGIETFDGRLQLWNITDDRLIANMHFAGSPSSIVFSHDSKRLVTTSLGLSGARVWSTADGRLLATLHHEGAVVYAQFSPDDRHVVTAGYDHTARVWDSEDGRILAILQGHSGSLRVAEFSPDGQRIVTASLDQTARIWSIVSARTQLTLKGHDGFVYVSAFSRDGQRILTASVDNTARIWNAIDGRLLHTLRGHTDHIYARFSPDGQLVLTAGYDGTARLWNVTNGGLRTVLQEHSDQLSAAQFSPDGQRIVTAGKDKTARVWSTAEGKLLVTLNGHNDVIFNAQFSPDGKRIVTASSDKTARIWNTENGRLLSILQGHNDKVFNAQFSPDGQRVITSGMDNIGRIWNANDGSLLATFGDRGKEVISAEYFPDGKRILSLDKDNCVRFWNAADGRLLAVLQGHTDRVGDAQFSPDGRRVITASMDTTARVWNTADGSLVAVLQGHTMPVVNPQFSPDGQRIVTSSFDSTARVWQLLTLDDVARILDR